MLLGEATQNHPFNYAYPVENPNDTKAIQQLYRWVCNVMNVNFPLPPVLVVNHDHLQEAVQRLTELTPAGHVVYGCYSPKYETVFISDRTKPSRNTRHAATLVHEFVHYVQDMLDLPPKSVEEYEDEAYAIEAQFMIHG